MVRYENECVDCGFPCLRAACPHRNVPHIYCDRCGTEDEDIYEFEGEELCIECIKERLVRVNGND